jgi:lipopolysaccharide export system permease protein
MIFARYMLREFIKLYVSICFGFLIVYCVIDFLEKNTRYFPKYNVSASVVFEYYLVQMPKMFIDMSPFGVMFSGILTAWIFSRSGEIAVLRAAGQPVRRICAPLLSAGVIISLLCLFIGEYIVPSALLQMQRIEKVKIEKSELSKLFLESQWVSTPDSILHFQKLNQIEHSLVQPEYVVFRSPNNIEKIVHGKRAVFDGQLGTWKLTEATVSRFSESGELSQIEKVDSYATTVVSQPPKLLRDGISSDLVSFRELRQVLREGTSTGGAASVRETDLFQKLSAPFANLLFAFFAFPFALRRERQADTYIGIVASLIIAAVFWGSSAAMRAVAVSGLLPSYVAAWGPTLLFLVLGIVVMLRVDRRS